MSSKRAAACWNILGRNAAGQAREVFALLDGARVRTLPGALLDQGVEHACLLAGETDGKKLTRAPYLLRVPEDSETLRWLAGEGWEQNWGIYTLGAPGVETSFDTLLRDFREAMQARLPDGRVVVFRFYDPRVWRDFFPTCDARQLRVLFGRAAGAMACEDAAGDALLLDTVEGGRPKREIQPLPHD